MKKFSSIIVVISLFAQAVNDRQTAENIMLEKVRETLDDAKEDVQALKPKIISDQYTRKDYQKFIGTRVALNAYYKKLNLTCPWFEDESKRNKCQGLRNELLGFINQNNDMARFLNDKFFDDFD